MRLERETIINLNLTQTEKQALALVDLMLLRFQEKFSDETKFQSAETGELFEVEELSRVRGILDMIHTNAVLYEMD